MKTRNKVFIAIASGVAVIALIVALISCNKKAAPDISSFSTANNQESEVIAETLSEVSESTSSILQAEESISDTSADIANTTETTDSTAQQTGQTDRNTEDADNSSGTGSSSPKPSTQTEADPTPVPTTTPSASPTSTPVPTATPTPEPTPAPTATPIPTPTIVPEYDPKYKNCIADVEYWAGQDNCYHGFVYGVPCVRNSAGDWEPTDAGEDMVWDAIAAEHPDFGGYTDEVVEGSCRNFS